MLFFKKICYIYLHDRLKGRGGVGLICVRITETVAAQKTSPMVPHGQKGEYNTGNFIK